ncbi:TlpA disulfide reductase family protein [Sporosarcina sp. GW1-11]|uniref:peroxiredoxin family protein n=1 Tax=Sporosarcina sp. GW1-11 TaxID=2899126 RepID=UPI00294C4F1B|nr:TlpA disulfide reductase family protein [Sporosarcina sp. GW1-11]MDV6378990.1 TlpA disulfide reductase family protein [Sporosarcina sp. GW1-11]
MKKKWSILISVFIVITMVTIIIIINREIKKETGGIDGYESAMIQDMPKDQVERLPEDWQVAENAENPGLNPGDLAPDFELTTLDGKNVKLSDYRGKTVLLNFWASWCPPCRSEMPHMEAYYKEYSESENVEILAVNMTKTEKNKEQSAKDFVEEYQLTFPILLDKKSDVMKMYQVKVYPTTYIINEEGVITDKAMFPLDDKLLKELLDNSKKN